MTLCEAPSDTLPSGLKLIKKIGQGGYGKVYFATWKRENKTDDVAVKIIRAELDENQSRTAVVNEASIMSYVSIRT